ncbi:MAG TPA: hypothetical protein VLA82_06845 [Actinomycetota bacterium]|nr:hypothetical protein [Actinomycetota bacterium]
MRTSGLATTAAVVLLLTACTNDLVCTAIGEAPTISVNVSRILDTEKGPVTVRTCVGTTCGTITKDNPRRLDAVFLDLPSADGPDPVVVDIRIDGRGETIYEAAEAVRLVRRQPNGPDCGPTYWAAQLEATREGLSQTDAAPS